MLIIDKDKNFILKPNTDKPSDPNLIKIIPSDNRMEKLWNDLVKRLDYIFQAIVKFMEYLWDTYKVPVFVFSIVVVILGALGIL